MKLTPTALQKDLHPRGLKILIDGRTSKLQARNLAYQRILKGVLRSTTEARDQESAVMEKSEVAETESVSTILVGQLD